MDDFDSDRPVDIRGRLRAHGARQLTLARLSAPADWQAALREALAEHRSPRPLWFSSRDARLFLESFAIFFTATMAFLI